jgi:hypothetical protein
MRERHVPSSRLLPLGPLFVAGLGIVTVISPVAIGIAQRSVLRWEPIMVRMFGNGHGMESVISPIPQP